jgi:phosphonate transport system substrate-binding protein
MNLKLLIFRAAVTAITCLAFSSAGCSDRPHPGPTEHPSKIKLRIGLIPEQDIFTQKERHKPLAEYLSKRTGAEIELVLLTRYGNIIENFKAEKLDGAIFGSFTGALAIRKLGVEPLARPEYGKGVSTYYGMILVRKDSGIRTGADMKGKRFAFVDKATTAGWLLPMHFFKVSEIADYRSWFGETYFAGTHEDVIRDVLNGKADAGAAKDLVFDRMRRSDSRVAAELQVLAVSPPVPANSLAIRSDLEAPLKAELKKVMLQMDRDEEGRLVLEEFGATRFIETTVQDYQPVFTYAREAGFELPNYDYRNQ